MPDCWSGSVLHGCDRFIALACEIATASSRSPCAAPSGGLEMSFPSLWLRNDFRFDDLARPSICLIIIAQTYVLFLSVGTMFQHGSCRVIDSELRSVGFEDLTPANVVTMVRIDENVRHVAYVDRSARFVNANRPAIALLLQGGYISTESRCILHSAGRIASTGSSGIGRPFGLSIRC